MSATVIYADGLHMRWHASLQPQCVCPHRLVHSAAKAYVWIVAAVRRTMNNLNAQQMCVFVTHVWFHSFYRICIFVVVIEMSTMISHTIFWVTTRIRIFVANEKSNTILNMYMMYYVCVYESFVATSKVFAFFFVVFWMLTQQQWLFNIFIRRRSEQRKECERKRKPENPNATLLLLLENIADWL